MPEAATDPFGTDALRHAVLTAWSTSPTRFREDANAEEDLVRGGYRDRLVVELAQNAADAAARAGTPGRLLLRLRDGRLEVSNTGAALDAEGVASLASLRASAKRDPDGSVGHFGVGFAAVLAVTDTPVVRSTAGGVAFSAERTRELASGIPAVLTELSRRGGSVPVLRLPFPEAAPPEDGYTSTVVLPLRDTDAAQMVHRLLDDVDDALLLSLPWLAEVVVDSGAHRRRELRSVRDGNDVVVHDDGRQRRWRLVEASGELDPRLLADRPVEERQSRHWSVTWAVALDDDGLPVEVPGSVPAVLHAPTPSDEPVALPALLLATFPLDASRRHVAPGPACDFLVEQAARTYVGAVTDLAHERGAAALAMVPTPAAAGALDARIRGSVADLLREAAFLPAAEPGLLPLRPRQAVALEPALPELVELLVPVVAGLLPSEWCRDRVRLDLLGVRVLRLPDLLDALAEVTREPRWWRQLYQALLGVEAVALEGLPVPLADGRTVRGARSALVPDGTVDAALLAVLGPRIVHPDAVHPLLERLGAAPADAARLLGDPQLLARLPDADDDLVDAVLRTVGAANAEPGAFRTVGALPLRCADDTVAAASECVLPSTPLAALCDDDVPVVHASVVDRYGVPALLAVGCLDVFRVVRHVDVELDPDQLAAAWPDADGWADDQLDRLAAEGTDVELPPLAPEVPVVAGLDLVADDAWPRALGMLDAPDVRGAVVGPLPVVTADGRSARVLTPAAWWLREAPLFDGRTPVGARTADADGVLHGLYPRVVADDVLDAALLEVLGVRRTVAGLLAEPGGPGELLDRLADPDLKVAAEAVVTLSAALARLPASRWPDAPGRVRVPDGTASRVVPVADVVVVVAPHHLQLGLPAALPGPPALAELLDARTSDAVVPADPVGGSVQQLPEQLAAWSDSLPPTYVEHDDLLVGGASVDWWVGRDGQVHVATSDGLARALAWSTGQWSRRFELAAVLSDLDRADRTLAELAVERAFE